MSNIAVKCTFSGDSNPSIFISAPFAKRVIKPSGQSTKIVSLDSEDRGHFNTDNSVIFDTQTWTPKERCDLVPAGSKHHLPVIIHRHICVCIRGESQ